MRKLSAVLIAAALLAPATSYAQNKCADRSVVTQRLSVNYGEKYIGGGLRNAESIFEVWMAEDTGTWTIIMTMPSGLSCVMAAGTDWRVALPGVPEGIPG